MSYHVHYPFRVLIFCISLSCLSFFCLFCFWKVSITCIGKHKVQSRELLNCSVRGVWVSEHFTTFRSRVGVHNDSLSGGDPRKTLNDVGEKQARGVGDLF